MAKPAFCLALLFCLFMIVYSILPEFTPPKSQTQGQPWPMPQSYKSSGDVQLLYKYNFEFNVVGEDCETLRAATNRYFKIIFYTQGDRLKFSPSRNQVDGNLLESLNINLAKPCDDYPSLGMDESYDLKVSSGSASLNANSIWGVLRGLETFSQLIYENSNGGLQINNTVITDAPRFSWRGVLLDTARHYLAVDIIKQNLEAMAYNKLNVFHWHIVDDQSFPYQSAAFPGLSEQGAYDPYTHVYTQEDIAEIIEFARVRGIRVVPEFDTPGHSQSWGKSQKDLLTKCYTKGQPNGNYGPIDPTTNTTYAFLSQLMKELTHVFPDKYLHLGGDEVSFSCWESNPVVVDFMSKMGFAKNYSLLEEYYMQNLLKIVGDYGKGYIIWQEVVDNGAKVRPDTVVEVWKGGYANEMDKVTKKGYKAILSTCWYLNRIAFGADWKHSYTCEPFSFNGTKEQEELVIGGEMCFWGEYIDGTNLISRAWPRGSAVAERLWSARNLNDPNKAMSRFEEHRCRMVKEQKHSANILNLYSSYFSGNNEYPLTWELPVDEATVVEVWKGGAKYSPQELAIITKKGYKAVLAAPWYLDNIATDTKWREYYAIDPQNFTGTAAQKKLVVGGEACLWAEYVDNTNVESRLWPRASAIAERLWSPASVNDVTAAGPRLEEHRCRMVKRWIDAEPPSGPSFCQYEAPVRKNPYW